MRLRHVLHPTGNGYDGYGKDMQKSQLLYNKLAGAFEILPPHLYLKLINNIPQPEAFIEALAMIEANRVKLTEANEYLKKHTTQTISWLCEKFQINHPRDIGVAQFLGGS